MKRHQFGLLTYLALCLLGTSKAASLVAPFNFVALGDMPYNVLNDDARFEALIGQINKAKPAFSVHVGDIKNGGSPCTDATYQKVLRQFNLFAGPLVYTIGDNEWTDCYRQSAGAYNPLERLERVRQLFFRAVGNQSFGQKTLSLSRQPMLIENSRWTYNTVTFATLHIVGSNNGLTNDLPRMAEFLERNEANVAWIKDTFAAAEASNSPAVVLAFQADLWLFNPFFLTEMGFKDILLTLAAQAKAFGKPVLLIHGDTHVLVTDHPLTEAGILSFVGQASSVLQNVTRLEVMGDQDVRAVEVTVDFDNPALFKFKTIEIK